jgi:hypothetical protein
VWERFAYSIIIAYFYRQMAGRRDREKQIITRKQRKKTASFWLYPKKCVPLQHIYNIQHKERI